MTLPFDQAAEKYFTPPEESTIEAKDTVMSEDTIAELLLTKFGIDIHEDTEGNIPAPEIDEVICLAQAAISFKAGCDQAKKEFDLKFNPDYLDFQKGVEEGRQLGRREVVEWGNGKCPHKTVELADGSSVPVSCFECNKCLQNKLKEWGVE